MPKRRRIGAPARTRVVSRLAAVALFVATLGSTAIALPLNVGHRGFSASYPENTLVAIENSFLAGADITEIDLLRSSDGHVVVFHDDTVDRTTNGTGRVDSKTLVELQALDAGSWFHPAFAGVQIPTLVEALTLQQQLDMGPLLLDQKAGLTFGADIAAALAATGASAATDIMVTAWDIGQVNDIHALLPDATILWTDYNTNISGQTIADLQALGVDGFSLIFESYEMDPAFLTAVHEAGMDAYAWNLDLFAPETEEKMENSIAMGLDGYIVNDPALYATVLLPEPGTLTLFVVALAWIGARSARRRDR